MPLVDLFRRGWSMIIRIILSTFFPNTLGYITLFFILSYGTQTLHSQPQHAAHLHHHEPTPARC